MTDTVELEAADTGLDDYVDLPAPVEVSDMMAAAQAAAAQPKPTIKEMIDAVTHSRWAIEDHQSLNLTLGFFAKPQPVQMRRAAALAATVNFLELIDRNQDAVKNALRGKK